MRQPVETNNDAEPEFQPTGELLGQSEAAPGVGESDRAATHGIRQSMQRILKALLPAIITSGIVLVLAAPSGYVVELPGPAYDTLGPAPGSVDDTRMITVQGAPTYPTTGSLNLLTVSMIGQPGKAASWLSVLGALFDPAREAVPIAQVFPPQQTAEQRTAENQAMMVDSQQTAIAAALNAQGIAFTTELSVGSVAAGLPAEGVLEPDDLILSANGVSVRDVDELRDVVAQNGTDSPVVLDIVRAGEQMQVRCTPTLVDSGAGEQVAVLGIGLQQSFDFPVDVTIQLDRVGGPSAGMMFALGILDVMTEGSLTDGRVVAGTGTISADGAVGPIGGARQKLFGAREAGATIMLLPAANCADLSTGLPGDIRVFAVETLDDSLQVLETYRAGGDLAALPSCSAPVE